MIHSDEIFAGFFQGGFECSTHKLRNGKRLDLVQSTGHDRFARSDYRRLKSLDIRTVREGLRWHLIERTPGRYDFNSAKPILDAGLELGITQIIDLFHFGWPDHIDILDHEFVDSLAAMAHSFGRLLNALGIRQPLVAPCNEISFFAWAAGDAEYLNPFWSGRGAELKAQLVRAAVAAASVLKSELPGVRLVWPEPVIHIIGDPAKPGDDARAEAYRLSMFEAWDMVSGRVRPDLGGKPEYLDIVGVNFYDRNQWVNHGRTLRPSDPEYRPFHRILLEVWDRYRRPMFISETGTEDEKRPEWLRYISSQVMEAAAKGVEMHGLCLYPILNHPGWEDDRHCCNGLFDYADPAGNREVYEPLARELRRQQQLLNSDEGRITHEQDRQEAIR